MIRRSFDEALSRIAPHAPQFARYLLSGGTAAGLEIGSYQLMLHFGVWYFTAAKISGMVGLLAAFIGHKFFAFRKRRETSRQLVRYAVLQGCNYIIQLAMVYTFVEFAGINATIAKILAIGITVLWNFFLYKFFVYA
ncbi:GtrA family protein [Candidatus Peregrinibacteria bacterium]|nr:GtrA family protein [Candidatus Peregrinibacteria bacterium]MBI3816630.1 GtrA family protein [Candidatus Peregrinibacteria bacterium]